jgi:hypothetical protein
MNHNNAMVGPPKRRKHHHQIFSCKARLALPLKHCMNSNNSSGKKEWSKQVNLQNNPTTTCGTHETPAASAANVMQGILTHEAKDPSTPSNRPRDNLFTLNIVYNVNSAKERQMTT